MGYHNNKTRKIIVMSLFVAVALVLSYFERLIPLTYIMPGLKLGLANIITVMALLTFTWFEVLAIVLIRIMMMTFFTGSAISFFYSLTGGLLSLIAMKLLLKYGSKQFSLVGVSIFGATVHNTGQMLVLSVITGSFRVGLQWLPYLLLAGIITGLMIGLISLYFYKHWRGLRLNRNLADS